MRNYLLAGLMTVGIAAQAQYQPPSIHQELNTEQSSFPGSFISTDNYTYFTAEHATHGQSIWRTDGTAAGTVHLASGRISSYLPGMYLTSGQASYLVDADTVYCLLGKESYNGLWKLTPNSAEIVPGAAGATGPSPVLRKGNTVYTLTYSGLYKVDLATNTSSSTPRTSFSPAPYYNQLGIYGDSLVVIARGSNGQELYTIDGANRMNLLKDINPGSGNGVFSYRQLAKTSNGLVFFGDDGTSGIEPWVTQGTAASTQRLRNINPTGSGINYYSKLHAWNGFAFFTANNGSGTQLYATDGTVGGTVTLVNNSSINFGINAAAGNASTFFIIEGNNLWVSDGTSAGTQLVKALGSGQSDDPAVYPTSTGAFLIANDMSGQQRLWYTDGTAAGTQVIKAIRTNQTDAFSYSASVMQDRLFFGTAESDGSRQLWVSDGTAAGTRRLTTVNTGSNSSSPRLIANTSLGLVFSAISNSTVGYQPFLLAAGTHQVTRLSNKASEELNVYYNEESDRVDVVVSDDARNTLYYVQEDSLWSSQGAADAAQALVPLNYNSNVMHYFNDHVLITSRRSGVFSFDIHTRSIDTILYANYPAIGKFIQNTSTEGQFVESKNGDLWKTDGSPSNTQLVTNLKTKFALGSKITYTNGITLNQKALHFIRSYSNNNYVLIASDGTDAGTDSLTTVSRLYSVGDNNPNIFIKDQNYVYFSDGSNIFRTDGTAAGTVNIFSAPRTIESFTVFKGKLLVHSEDLFYSMPLTSGTPGTATSMTRPFSGRISAFAHTDSFAVTMLLWVNNSKAVRSFHISDGTEDGTYVLPITDSVSHIYLPQIYELDNRIFFAYSTENSNYELWVFDPQRPVGIHRVGAEEVEAVLAPNPSLGDFSIRFEKAIDADVRLFNMQGQEVARQQVQQGTEVNFHVDLPQGLYFAHVHTKDAQKVFKVRIQ